jgi:hypothetical protein
MPTPTEVTEELFTTLFDDAKQAYIDYMMSRTPAPLAPIMQPLVDASVPAVPEGP